MLGECRSSRSRAMENSKIAKVRVSKKAFKAKARSEFDFESIVPSINGGLSVVEFQPKECVYRQGDPANAVFYLKKGKIKIAVVSKNGKEGVIAILNANDF